MIDERLAGVLLGFVLCFATLFVLIYLGRGLRDAT